MHTGIDYLVNIQNGSSRTFTVTFQSKQANSTEHVIVLAGDIISEGIETVRLRVVAARFIGQAATIYRPQDGLTNTFAEAIIEDDECKFMNTPSIICLQSQGGLGGGPIPVMHALSPSTVVEVSWILSIPIEVREGEGVRLELFAQAFGLYATPIEIGVVCAGVSATGVPSGVDTISNTDTLEHAIIYHTSPCCLQPTLTETLLSKVEAHWRSQMLRPLDLNQVIELCYRPLTTKLLNLTLLIIDDVIAEPCEYFICTLQGGAVDRVRGVEPNRVTVRICDDDGEDKCVCTVHIV